MQNVVSLMHLQMHPVRSTEQQQAVMLMTVPGEVQDVYIPVCQMHKWCGMPCCAAVLSQSIMLVSHQACIIC